MPDPKLPAAKRRLSALLRDEEYGPKLVRLRRADERRVLDLVYEGKGREARAAIDDLDAGRRRRRTLGEKARRYARLPRRTRSAEWRNTMESVKDHEQQFWKLYRAAILAA
jgi:hypothetical protein